MFLHKASLKEGQVITIQKVCIKKYWTNLSNKYKTVLYLKENQFDIFKCCTAVPQPSISHAQHDSKFRFRPHVFRPNTFSVQ